MGETGSYGDQMDWKWINPVFNPEINMEGLKIILPEINLEEAQNGNI